MSLCTGTLIACFAVALALLRNSLRIASLNPHAQRDRDNLLVSNRRHIVAFGMVALVASHRSSFSQCVARGRLSWRPLSFREVWFYVRPALPDSDCVCV